MHNYYIILIVATRDSPLTGELETSTIGIFVGLAAFVMIVMSSLYLYWQSFVYSKKQMCQKEEVGMNLLSVLFEFCDCLPSYFFIEYHCMNYQMLLSGIV